MVSLLVSDRDGSGRALIPSFPIATHDGIFDGIRRSKCLIFIGKIGISGRGNLMVYGTVETGGMGSKEPVLDAAKSLIYLLKPAG
jgi:hypothetical protein